MILPRDLQPFINLFQNTLNGVPGLKTNTKCFTVDESAHSGHILLTWESHNNHRKSIRINPNGSDLLNVLKIFAEECQNESEGNTRITLEEQLKEINRRIDELEKKFFHSWK